MTATQETAPSDAPRIPHMSVGYPVPKGDAVTIYGLSSVDDLGVNNETGPHYANLYVKCKGLLWRVVVCSPAPKETTYYLYLRTENGELVPPDNGDDRSYSFYEGVMWAILAVMDWSRAERADTRKNWERTEDPHWWSAWNAENVK